jgi:hypothetical protein
MRSEWEEVMKPAIRRRIRLVAAERKLSDDQIAKAMTLKHEPFLEFAERHMLSLDWLLCGDLKGLLRMKRWQAGIMRHPAHRERRR